MEHKHDLNTKEGARAYLKGLGLNPDELVKEGMSFISKIKEEIAEERKTGIVKVGTHILHNNRKVIATGIIPTNGDEVVLHYKIGNEHWSRTITKKEALEIISKTNKI